MGKTSVVDKSGLNFVWLISIIYKYFKYIKLF